MREHEIAALIDGMAPVICEFVESHVEERLKAVVQKAEDACVTAADANASVRCNQTQLKDALERIEAIVEDVIAQAVAKAFAETQAAAQVQQDLAEVSVAIIAGLAEE
jgi:uncharacterized protein YbcI